MVLIFLYRDSAVSTLRTVCAYKGLVLAARPSGKLKAIFQATVIIAILLARILVHPFPQWFNDALIQQVAWWLVLAAAIWTAWSFVDYVAGNRRLLAGVAGRQASAA
jgi:CDP-diacylglycerol--glycerol-3-phosphate 3-phosphatidyltransferase